MLSRDAIKTCESLRYSGYSDSNSAVYLWVSKRHKKKRKSRAQKNTKTKKQKTKNKKKLSLVSRRHNFDTPHKKRGERSVCV